MKKLIVLGLCCLFLMSFISAGIFSKFSGQATLQKKLTPSLDLSSGDAKTLSFFSLGSKGYTFPYYSNRDIIKKNPSTKMAVIVVHGNGRDASGYFDSVLMGAETRGVLGETLIIAPHFTISATKTRPEVLYWDGNDGWKIGDKSSNFLKERFSSFEVIDLFVNELNDKEKFPSLQEIVIIGHSAGGQFVNRYAAGNSVDRAGKVSMRYVVANPSSYLYFDSGRVIGNKYVVYKENPFIKTNLFELT